MPLSWNEIRDRATSFSREWKHAENEDAEAKSFWDGFFDVFGAPRRRVASFERRVKKLDGKDGYIDLLWKGTLLVEHKSRGKDLDCAYQQARDYFAGLRDRDLPRYVLVSDFARFRLFDLDTDTQVEFALSDLPKRIKHFAFIAGYTPQRIREQDPVNAKAAETLGRLHDALKTAGYDGHPLEVLLVRLLFCLFADDTGIFELQSFRDFIEQRTGDDGADLGGRLAELFQVLNTEPTQRQRNLDLQLAAFPYVNGAVFAEPLPIAQFDSAMRQTLLDCCALDWAAISPAIFGAMFQSVMDAKARRNLGAHYTSESNILKLIKPLFLDDLWAEFDRVKDNRARLLEFHQRLRQLTFLDPACGCGNFLVITYRELRLLELAVLRAAHGSSQKLLDIHPLIKLNVDQFYGIEIEEFPAQIAQVALWLVDHQMNQQVAAEFGMYFARVPLVTTPSIHCGNALTTDWNAVLPAARCSYVLGNPPFIGHHLQTQEQKALLRATLRDVDAAGVLDFVSAWYVRTAEYLQHSQAEAALVATNSITQGEQVGLLWSALLARGVRINFAHTTFRWSNEGRGVAAVYCVIIGFALRNRPQKLLFEYDSPDSEPHARLVSHISPYLIDGPDILLSNRSAPICPVPGMMYGSKPTDGGHYLFTEEEAKAFLEREPGASKFMRPFISAHEYLHGEKRFVLWLVDAEPAEINQLPAVRERVALVAAFRAASKAATTRAYPYPMLFRQVTQPSSVYVLIPGHTSENRRYIPFGFFTQDVIVGNSCFSLPGASLFHFGVIQSQMHMAWVRYTCGRLKSDYRYSKDIVYNNFPWPESSTDKQRAAIEAAAQGVLDARAQFPQSSLADLYDLLTMPPALVAAHQALDGAVDAAYGRRNFRNDAERVAFLFGRYQAITSLLPSAEKPARKRSTKPRAQPDPGA